MSQPCGEVYTYMTGTHKTSGRGKGAKNKMKGTTTEKSKMSSKLVNNPIGLKLAANS
jgi:hypothetical protein